MLVKVELAGEGLTKKDSHKKVILGLFVWMLLSTSVERVSVSRMQDFYLACYKIIYFFLIKKILLHIVDVNRNKRGEEEPDTWLHIATK